MVDNSLPVDSPGKFLPVNGCLHIICGAVNLGSQI